MGSKCIGGVVVGRGTGNFSGTALWNFSQLNPVCDAFSCVNNRVLVSNFGVQRSMFRQSGVGQSSLGFAAVRDALSAKLKGAHPLDDLAIHLIERYEVEAAEIPLSPCGIFRPAVVLRFFSGPSEGRKPSRFSWSEVDCCCKIVQRG